LGLVLAVLFQMQSNERKSVRDMRKCIVGFQDKFKSKDI